MRDLLMPALQQPVTPFVTELVEPTTEPTTVVDVLVGAFAIVGAVAAVAIVLGLLFAAVMIGFRRRGGNQLAGRGSSSQLGLGGSGPAPD